MIDQGLLGQVGGILGGRGCLLQWIVCAAGWGSAECWSVHELDVGGYPTEHGGDRRALVERQCGAAAAEGGGQRELKLQGLAHDMQQKLAESEQRLEARLAALEARNKPSAADASMLEDHGDKDGFVADNPEHTCEEAFACDF